MATLPPPRLTRAHVRTLRRATRAASADFAPVFTRLIADVRAQLVADAPPLPVLARSATLRDRARAALLARLRLHGFRPVGHGCWSRDGGLPMREARALEECDADVDAALRARGLGDLLAGHQGEQRYEQSTERQGGAGEVHEAKVTQPVRAGQCGR